MRFANIYAENKPDEWRLGEDVLKQLLVRIPYERLEGRRFKMTDAREIPLNISTLELLVVLPREAVWKAKFRLAAEVEVGILEKCLTMLFTRDVAAATAEYLFPE